MNELKLYTFLVEFVSGPFPDLANGVQQQGIYTFECAYNVIGTATCRFRWFSPDETDIFALEGSTSIQFGALASSATINDCQSGSYASQGGYNFPSSGITFEDFLCNETPITVSASSNVRRITPIAP